MSYLNKVCLMGNLGADPEVKNFTNGGRIANLRIATTEKWKDKATGEKKEKTEWHSVTIGADGLVGVVEKYLRKGSKVYLEGQLRTRKWQDQSGNDRYTTEVVVGIGQGVLKMLDGPRSDGQQGSGGSPASQSSGAPSGSDSGDRWGSGAYDDLDDDVPF